MTQSKRTKPTSGASGAAAADVAAYVLSRLGGLGPAKLHKLIYYSQAWHLAWEGKPLFRERVEAWANGPIVAELWAQHRGTFFIEEWPEGDSGRLSSAEIESVDSVLESYGSLSDSQLAQIVRHEEPWLRARHGLGDCERGYRRVARTWMGAFYRRLQADEAALEIGQIDWAPLGLD